jgi:hypothetical protein
MVTIECIIPQKHHRTVMGAKGCKVQGVTSEFDVQIKFPDRDAQGMDHWYSITYLCPSDVCFPLPPFKQYKIIQYNCHRK